MSEMMQQQTAGFEAGPTGKRFGPVAAVFLAGGIGAVALGILTVLAEASEDVKDFLQLNDRVGPLSGKTVFALVAYFVSWAILYAILRERNPNPRAVWVWAAVLVVVGIGLTFPPIFTSFAAD